MKRLNAEWIFEIHFCSKCLEKCNKFKSIMKNKEENFKLFIFQYTNSVQMFTFNLFVITKLKLLKQKIKRKPNRLLNIYIFFLLKTNKIFFFHPSFLLFFILKEANSDNAFIEEVEKTKIREISGCRHAMKDPESPPGLCLYHTRIISIIDISIFVEAAHQPKFSC